MALIVYCYPWGMAPSHTRKRGKFYFMYDFQKNYQKREKHDLGESFAYKLLQRN